MSVIGSRQEGLAFEAKLNLFQKLRDETGGSCVKDYCWAQTLIFSSRFSMQHGTQDLENTQLPIRCQVSQRRFPPEFWWYLDGDPISFKVDAASEVEFQSAGCLRIA